MKDLKLSKKVVANLSNSHLETLHGGAESPTPDYTKPFTNDCQKLTYLCNASAQCPTTYPTNSTIPQCGTISGDYAPCATTVCLPITVIE